MNRSNLLICLAVMMTACLIKFWGKKKQYAQMPQVMYETKVLKPETRTYSITFPATLEGTSEVKVYPQV